MVRDALAHRLQPGEQPSPVLLVIEQAVDLPPVSRVRVLLLAQDVVERVGRGHDHDRDGRPPGQPSSAIPARESQTVVPDADLGGERELSSANCPRASDSTALRGFRQLFLRLRPW